MTNATDSLFKRELKALFKLQPTSRPWHVPFMASVCTGLPLFIGLYFNNLQHALLACMAGLVILYLPATSLVHRMITMMACSLGFIFSFTIGLLASFNPIVLSVVFAVFAMCVNWVVNYLNLAPPRSFFFIFLASIAGCMSFNLDAIPLKVGLVAMGTLLACTLALIYSLLVFKRVPGKTEVIRFQKSEYANIVESAIIGSFVGLSMLAAQLMKLENPYWVPASCAAVMQGGNLQHIWQRTFHRVLGTLIGLGVCWALLQLPMTPISVCICLFMLQFMTEVFIVRNYAMAVIFITPMAIFLTEATGIIQSGTANFLPARFLDILLGSCIGAIGGYIVHNKQIRDRAERQLRVTRVTLKRR